MIKPQFPHGYTVFIDEKQIPKDDVIGVDFEDGLELLDELKVTIRNDKLKYTKEHSKLKGSKIKLEGGWIGLEWDTLFTGKIARVDRNYAEDNTLTISALPVGVDEGWHTKRTRDLGTYESHGDVIADIIAQNHQEYKTQIEGGGMLIVEPIQQNETDLEFCKRMARESGGTEFAIKGKTVIFRKPDPTSEPVITFERGVNVISLSAKETDQVIASETKVLTESEDNSIRLDVTAKTIEDQRSTDGQKADNVERAVTEDGRPIFIEYLPRASGAEADKVAAGKASKPATQETIITVSAIGSIKAVAGKTALVKGYGCDDGKYYIRKASHSFKDDYTITCELANKQAVSS